MRQKFFFSFLILIFFEIDSIAQSVRDKIEQRQAGKGQENSMAPDYTDLYFWAAHPAKKDMSDSIPSFISDKTRDTLADVFFFASYHFYQIHRGPGLERSA